VTACACKRGSTTSQAFSMLTVYQVLDDATPLTNARQPYSHKLWAQMTADIAVRQAQYVMTSMFGAVGVYK
jgi:hypothetical protein